VECYEIIHDIVTGTLKCTVFGPPVVMALCVLRFRMEEMASRQKCIREYTGEAAADNRQEVVLQLGVWVEG